VINSHLEVKKTLLEKNELDDACLIKVLNKSLAKGAEYADIYLQHSVEESWFLEDGVVKRGFYNISQGGAVHAVIGEQSGFAYTENLILPAMLQAATAASNIVDFKRVSSPLQIKTTYSPDIYSHSYQAIVLEDSLKIKLLNNVNSLAYSLDSRVKQVRASLSINYEALYFMNNEGESITEGRPLIRLDVFIIMMNDNGLKEESHAGQGGRMTIQEFLVSNPVDSLVKEAVAIADHGLRAEQAPAGVMPVVLAPGWPGVLLHEAVGHGLEADFNRRNSSAFSKMMGEKVASEFCTIIDDATIPNARGSLAVDDEGVVGQETVLIENGILKSYLTDRLSAKIMGMPKTGNGRRESYAFLPMPRMTNTFMQAGKHDPEDIIKSVDKGIYCINFSGGQVDITSGKFVFSANQAYLIENGKLTKPVKNLTLIGDGPEILKEVSMVGYDLALDNGIGVCGKDGQSVPVGVGQPTMKLDKLVVGGSVLG